MRVDVVQASGKNSPYRGFPVFCINFNGASGRKASRSAALGAGNARRWAMLGMTQSHAPPCNDLHHAMAMDYDSSAPRPPCTHEGDTMLNPPCAPMRPYAPHQVMAMDYGDSAAPNPAQHGMGNYAIEAVTATRAQAQSVGLTNAKLGVIPMIGVNDVMSEVSSLSHGGGVVMGWLSNVMREVGGGSWRGCSNGRLSHNGGSVWFALRGGRGALGRFQGWALHAAPARPPPANPAGDSSGPSLHSAWAPFCPGAPSRGRNTQEQLMGTGALPRLPQVLLRPQNRVLLPTVFWGGGGGAKNQFCTSGPFWPAPPPRRCSPWMTPARSPTSAPSPPGCAPPPSGEPCDRSLLIHTRTLLPSFFWPPHRTAAGAPGCAPPPSGGHCRLPLLSKSLPVAALFWLAHRPPNHPQLPAAASAAIQVCQPRQL